MNYEDEDDSILDWRKVLFVGLGSIIFLYIAKDWGYYTIPKNWTILVCSIAAYLIGQLPYWMSKYKMPQVNVDGCHGSFQHNQSPWPVPDYYIKKNSEGKPEKVKFNWLVYGLGASLLPVPTRGKDATLIVPQFQMDTKAKNHRGATQVFLCPLIQLPEPLFDFLMKNKADYNIEKIYIGYHSRSYVPKDFDDADKNLKILQLQASNNEKSKMLSGNFSEIEKVKNLVDTIAPRVPWYQTIFGRSPNADAQPQS